MNFGMHSGIVAVLAAATLFGVSTPLAKLLLGYMDPWPLAALLYLGSGIGLWIMRRIRRMPAAHLGSGDWGWLAAAIAAGGIIGPVSLMVGLSAMPGSDVSLLLNAEGIFTTLLAWFAFKENFDRRIALGMLAIVVGTIVLTFPQEMRFSGAWSTLAVLGACLAWAIDNNLTRKVSLSDASFIAMVKGLVAGMTNLVLAHLTRAQLPGIGIMVSAMLLGFASYGMSLTLFVIGLRQLGTARTGAYFSIVLLGESVTMPLLVAGALMALGTWLHLTERHEHRHRHDEMEHDHEHIHDEHHQHVHDDPVVPGTQHRHLHRHEPLTHVHPHFPDAHHPRCQGECRAVPLRHCSCLCMATPSSGF
ncbi:DMT family transporter [Ferrovum sp.]|uniref:DMT family transporter n=2 Tax=Ferrovum sp. TaxID=2609467 RepID=UPI0034581FF6